MDVRVTQFGSETEPESYDLPEQHSSDSSFDRRMLQHMTRQRQTRREIHPRRMANVSLGLFDRKPRGALENKTESVKSPPSQRQRRRLNRPLEDFNRNGQNRKEETTAAHQTQVVQGRPPVVDSASQSLFRRYENVKNGGTPVVGDSDPNIWNMAADDAIPTVEDSPLSRKSVGRGTPGTAQSTKSRALEKVLSWNMSDDFDENSIIASTPAFFGKRMTLAELKQAELDASALRDSLLDERPALYDSEDLDQPNRTGGHVIRENFTKPYKTQLQAIRDKQAQTERTRFSRPLSSGGDNEQLQSLRDLDFADTENEVFVSLPNIEFRDQDTASPQRQRSSISPGRKENIPPPSHHISRAAPKVLHQDLNIDDQQQNIKLVSPLEPIQIYEDPLSTQAEHQVIVPQTAAERVERRRRARQSKTEATRVSPMPGRTRTNDGDSIDVLRRLSRSVSGTPTPQKSPPLPEGDASVKTKLSSSRLGLDAQTRDSESVIPLLPGGSTTTSATNDVAVSKEDSERLQPKTPRVTGAWIETPMITSKFQLAYGPREESSSSRNFSKASPIKVGKRPNNDAALKATAPSLPYSALSAVVDKVKGVGRPNQSEDAFGDTTMNSLEALMDPAGGDDSWTGLDLNKQIAPGMLSEEDRTAIIELLEEKISRDLPYSNGLPASSQERKSIRDIVEQRMERGFGKQQLKAEPLEETGSSSNRDAAGPRSPMTPRRKDRLLEELQLQRMSEHVNSMHSRTRSLSKGLGRIERKLADTTTCSSPTCSGDCYASHPVSAYSRLVQDSLYREMGGKTRPTTLGWILFSALLWSVSELTLWSLSSNPIFASFSNTDYGPFKTGPSPPFLLLSTILQPLGGSFDHGLDIAMAFWVWISSIFTMLIGDEVVLDGIGKASRVISSTTTRALVESMVTGEADYSMDKDELVGWIK